MKITPSSVCIIISFLIVCYACKKDKVVVEKSYSPTSIGSSWNYKGFITESTSNKMTGKALIKFNKTYYEKEVSANNQTLYYYGTRDGENYYSVVTDPNNISAENEVLYLKANAEVGETWIVDIKHGSNSLGNQWTYKIIDKELTKTVNGKIYDHVIHTERFSDGKYMHSYYGLGVGLIEVDYEDGANSTLESYSIK